MGRAGWPTLALLALGCGSSPGRPQALVVIDTNTPTVGQLSDRPELSAAAALDTLLVEVLSESGQVLDALSVGVVEAQDWPVSFGVARQDAAARVLVRARLFHAATAGNEAAGPAPGVTIDRVIDLTLPNDDTLTALIELDGDCIGVPARFGRNAATCVSAQAGAVAPTDAYQEIDDAAAVTSRVGTWSRALAVPCAGTASGDSVCIPGGFFVLGARDVPAFDAFWELGASPVKAAYVSPFWMDRTEVTAADYRALGMPEPSGLAADDPDYVDCTFDDEAGDFAINCMTYEDAMRACKGRGGTLPTEAQWEFAARGRGRGFRFPWGNGDIDCCVASTARRRSALNDTSECSGRGPEPVGAHEPRPECGGLGDVSLDGVLDLGGGMSELTQDRFLAYDHECWGEGLLIDPQCVSDDSSSRTYRGGNWTDGQSLAQSALRHRHFSGGDFRRGFRCVYPDQP
jgi:formylglycine-generating enzyme required for sulfatase activity